MRKSELIEKLLDIRADLFYNDIEAAEKKLATLIESLEVDKNNLKRIIHNKRISFEIGSEENKAYHTLYEKIKEAEARGEDTPEFLKKIKSELVEIDKEIANKSDKKKLDEIIKNASPKVKEIEVSKKMGRW